MRGKLPWSKASWLAQIQKLELKRGDILLVRHPEIVEQLVACGGVEFSVPIILDPSGVGISKLKKQDLLDALDQLDALENANQSS